MTLPKDVRASVRPLGVFDCVSFRALFVLNLVQTCARGIQ